MATIDVNPLPNREALEFWKDKVRLGPGMFSKLSDEAKLRAFAVSGIAKGAELESVFNGLTDAIEKGTPFEAWKKSLADVWEKRGWTGVRAWRVDNIFRTNIQTAFHVGRYKQMTMVSQTRPYWKYDAVNDSRTRPAHRALNGKIFRFDHPFWDTWYPPNGYRCRCGVSTLSAREIERDGLKIDTDDPTGHLVEPTTPSGMKMPARPLMPDPGFANHPGKSVWEPLTGMLRDRTETWPTAISSLVMSDMAAGPVFASWFKQPEGNFPLAVVDDDAAKLIKSKSRTVQISAETAVKQADNHPELSPAEYRFVQQAITKGRRIQDSPRTLVYVLEESDGYVTVVKSTVDGDEIFMTSFRRLSANEARREKEIARLLRKEK